MDRKQIALLMVIISALMGIMGMILFYQAAEGINFPIYIALMTILIIVVARLVNKPINRRNVWIVIPLLFFAVMVALRASYLLIGLNIGATLCLGALYVRYLVSASPLDTASLTDYLFAPLDVGIYMIYAPLAEAFDSLVWIKERGWKDMGHLSSILRGLLFTIPILLVFGILLGSADLVFAEQIGKLFSWFSFKNADDLIMRTIFSGVFAWFMLTALSYAIARRNDHHLQAVDQDKTASDETGADDENLLRKTRPGLRIGMIEATMILGSVTALFAFFVLIQFTYLFGGQSNIGEGLATYSTYARRGFFELVAVAVIVLGMILYLDRITIRRIARDGLLFRGLSIAIVGLTLVMLVSAWKRMELYELAYGFTYLRVLTHVFMFWLAVLLGFAILHLFRVRENIFALGVLLACIGYLGTLNIMNIDSYIAERNIAAYHDKASELDLCYLRALSVDAYPVMQAFFESESDENIRSHIGNWLYYAGTQSARHMSSPLAWHAAYAFAEADFTSKARNSTYQSANFECYNADLW